MKVCLTILLALSIGLAACDKGPEPSKGMPSVAASELVKDPVCGMSVDPGKSLSEDYRGKKYFFCSDDCLRKFKNSPEKYTVLPLK